MFDWLFLLSFYLPFQIALNPGIFLPFWGLEFASGFDFSSLRFFAVLFFLIWFFRVRKKRISFSGIGFQGVILVIFLVFLTFSLLGAEDAGAGARKILYFVSIFPLYFLAAGAAGGREKTEKLLLGLVLGAAAISFFGIIQFFSQFVFGLENVYRFWAVNILPVFSGFNLGALILAYPSWLVNISAGAGQVGGRTIMRAFSFFSDPHVFSLYLGLTLPFATVFLAGARATKRILFFVSAYLIVFLGLLLSFTRGAYLAAIISLLAVSVLFWKHLGSRKLSFFLLCSLLVFVIPPTPFSDRFYSSFDLSEGSNLGRLEMWENAGRVGWENLWQGVGLGNYFLTVDSGLDYRNPVTAHNLYLDLLSETGVFALLLWLVLIGGTIWFLFRRLNGFSFERRQKAALIGLIGSLVYFSVHSFFETTIYNPSALAALMMVLGLSSALLGKEDA